MVTDFSNLDKLSDELIDYSENTITLKNTKLCEEIRKKFASDSKYFDSFLTYIKDCYLNGKSNHPTFKSYISYILTGYTRKSTAPSRTILMRLKLLPLTMSIR